ncbi:MAG: SirB2 family protein [Inhella sp.]
MPYDYPQIQELHFLLAMVSMAMIAVRGLGLLLGARWPLDSRLRTINGGVDILLTVTGLSLWGLLNISPVHHGWLMAKLVLLPIYALLGALAFNPNRALELRVACYLGALLCMGLIVGVSQTRDPWLGLL